MYNTNTKNLKQCAILHPTHKNNKGEYYPKPTNIKTELDVKKIKTTKLDK